MKHILVITVSVLLLVTLFANSQTRMSRREYIDLYKDIAIREMHRSGIPASITMAQGCLESDNGNSSLSRKSNNHFGIKCKTGWDGPRVFHNDDALNECFRKYASVEESYIDHTDFLIKNQRYAFLFSYRHTDYKAWANGLKKAGYATDPNYPERLIKIIEEENLHALDKVKPGEIPERPVLAGDDAIQDTREKIKQTLNKITLNPYDRREVSEVNGLQVIYTVGGDTYESIAREMDMKPWEIYHYNDLPKDAEEPRPNTMLYIVRKRYSAPKGKDFHTVKGKETMYDISQQYGVKLSSLYRKNRMKKGSDPDAGEKVYLRSRKPKGE